MDYVSLGCCSLAFVLYINTLNAGFVYDDSVLSQTHRQHRPVVPRLVQGKPPPDYSTVADGGNGNPFFLGPGHLSSLGGDEMVIIPSLQDYFWPFLRFGTNRRPVRLVTTNPNSITWTFGASS
ncbi:hypothetical protein ZHAS_00004156 [Anopheles sinensis]|uniref:Uncharacterized protein n=1 Tax=Anopheles sinensis TaxID=74873 RepID=A0A084VG65_ANOSI|nr:hypothetical protein ZHAS_00004156 [Anopheles sinensis]